MLLFAMLAKRLHDAIGVGGCNRSTLPTSLRERTSFDPAKSVFEKGQSPVGRAGAITTAVGLGRSPLSCGRAGSLLP